MKKNFSLLTYMLGESSDDVTTDFVHMLGGRGMLRCTHAALSLNRRKVYEINLHNGRRLFAQLLNQVQANLEIPSKLAHCCSLSFLFFNFQFSNRQQSINKSLN